MIYYKIFRAGKLQALFRQRARMVLSLSTFRLKLTSDKDANISFVFPRKPRGVTCLGLVDEMIYEAFSN